MNGTECAINLRDNCYSKPERVCAQQNVKSKLLDFGINTFMEIANYRMISQFLCYGGDTFALQALHHGLKLVR